MRIAFVGHNDRVLGVGEAGRRLALNLASLGYQVDEYYVPFGKSLLLKQKSSEQDFDKSVFDLIILAVNPDLLIPTLFKFGLAFNSEIPKVGFWSWEFEDTPRTWRIAAELVDEIWTISTFALRAIQKIIPDTEVHVVPLSLKLNETNLVSLTESQLAVRPDKFTVLCSFDFFSGFDRKNPLGAIEAFQRAFGKNSSVAQLVVKYINAPEKSSYLAQLESIASIDSSIHLIGSNLSEALYESLFETCDVYISLHRCEGYGLNIVDALKRGIPVIATDYSGNRDFQNESNSSLVPYALESANINYSVYKLSTHWAKPSIEVAAAKLVEIQRNAEQFRFLRENRATAFEAFFESINAPLVRNLADRARSLQDAKASRRGFSHRARFGFARIRTLILLLPRQALNVCLYRLRVITSR